MTKERLIENRDKQSFERVPFDYEDKPVETVSVERRQLFRDGFDTAVIILEDEIMKKEEIECVIANIMAEETQDGNTKGCDVIASFVKALLNNEGDVWLEKYTKSNG